MARAERNHAVEELASAVTHGLGLALSLAGFVVLLVLAILRGGTWHIAGCGTYGLTLVLLYLASTLYHSIRSPRSKHILRILDHSAIYLLIAGTYTPFTLVNLRGVWGWSLFGAVWSLCIAGVVFKSFFINRLRYVSTLLYIGMGWMCLIAIKPLVQMVPAGGLAWLIAGGVLYTSGVIFFGWNRVRFNHAIWHLFVLAGSICHYFAVILYVVPRG
jgi:hemolysin III